MKKIDKFDLAEGEVVNGKYEILELLGKGWEGEVYLVKEIESGIERAAKFFFPKKNKRARSNFYAKKLHKLRHCEIVLQYYTQDTYYLEGVPITVLISEFIEGEMLSEFMKSQPGKRLNPFVALHLLHALAEGIEEIHRMGEYHGDLHTDNIIIQRFGLNFEVKILDLYSWGSTKGENIKGDVVDLIQVFHEILGGKKHYGGLPKPIKDICCGLKRSLILKKFKTAGKLKDYIENLEWD
jgi:serine/threonine protein kinase